MRKRSGVDRPPLTRLQAFAVAHHDRLHGRYGHCLTRLLLGREPDAVDIEEAERRSGEATQAQG